MKDSINISTGIKILHDDIKTIKKFLKDTVKEPEFSNRKRISKRKRIFKRKRFSKRRRIRKRRISKRKRILEREEIVCFEKNFIE
jgi:hypothetical protein